VTLIVLEPATERVLTKVPRADEAAADAAVARAKAAWPAWRARCGGFEQSGYGRELGPHALDAYSEVKSVFYATEG
jgi:acyl-CoA reductase-like NAD-dependent aldehyde dehydrogenase